MLSFGLISTIRKCNHWKRKTRSTCVSFLLSDGNRESRARLIGKYANTVKHTNYLEACLNWRTLDACRTIVHKGSEQHHARSPRTMLAGLIRQLFLRCLIVTSVSPVCAAYPTRAIPSYPSLQNIFFFFQGIVLNHPKSEEIIFVEEKVRFFDDRLNDIDISRCVESI